MPATRASGRTVALQLLLLTAVFLFFLYVLGYANLFFPSSLAAQVLAIIVAGEIVLVEILYFRSFYRSRVSMRVAEAIPRAPLKNRVVTYNNFILLSVYTFILFIAAIAYVLTLPPLTGQVVYNVVGTLVTVQGLLLGLLGISAIQLASKPGRLKGLVALTISSILISVATIMLGQLSTPIPQYVLTGFFLVSVSGFSTVVGVYSWMIIETRTGSALEKVRN